nr:ATP-binding cassette domain-containing protein [Paramuribaculum sp.]
KYRIDAFHELSCLYKIDLTERNTDLSCMNSGYIGSKIFEAEGINKSYGDKVILRDFTYTFARGEKVGIIGPNGVGKSTFIKMLLSEVAQDSGQWNVGTTVRFGYYSQQGIKFDNTKKVIDAVTDMMEEVTLADGVTRYSPMQFLNRFLFSPADQQKYIHTLSGGEKARLHLATVLMTSPNFLILDEPTNDLDIMTLGLLEEYLAEFKGCVIVVSHDRFFLDSIVDHIFVFEGNGVVKDFPGNYTDYRQALAEKKRLEASESAPVAKPHRQEKSAPRKEKMSFKEKQEFARLTEDIDRLTAEKNEIDTKFSSGEVIDDVAALSARYSEITSQLDEMEMRWLELSEKE